MKKLILLVLLLANFFGYAQTKILDENFERALITLGIDTGTPDGEVSTSEVRKIKSLNIPKNDIFDLTGLEDFISLEYLDCQENKIRNLDLRQNTALISLVCWGNKITNLNLTLNTALYKLNCDKNLLTSLNVSQNTALKELSCEENQIGSLDLRLNTALTKINCATNQISSLDLRQNTALKELNCTQNLLTSLDVSKNTALISLQCPINSITSLDLTNNTALTFINCFFNKISNLDLSLNTALKDLYCGQNQLIGLDVSNNTALTIIQCPWNFISNLDLTKNKDLEILDCNNNLLLRDLNLKNGNYTKLTSLDLKNNPSLTCIQVDDKIHFDDKWSANKDPTASFSENCINTAGNTPPVVTASGDQTYCPGTALKIATAFAILDPDDTGTDSIYIQISSAYVNGQDLLALANPGLHTRIKTVWDALAGKLILSSPTTGTNVSYSDLIAAVRDVEFSNSSPNPTGTRNFSITVGSANFLPSTNHYYEFVPNVGITWTSAKTAAEGLNYYGLKGYLATLLTSDEVTIAGAQAKGAGWIGGTDEKVEGEWRWVTGPEGLANGGTGVVFWIGVASGYAPAPLNFAYWNTANGEPNQRGDEDYAHIKADSVAGPPGSWNDLSNTGSLVVGDPYQPKGYIVEYGGMPLDPPLKISASTSMKMSQLTVAPATAICSGEKTTLQATAISGTINWYDAATGGTLLYTGTSFTTPALTATTTYYVDNGCFPRTAIVISVNPLPIVKDVTIVQCDTDLVVDGKTFFNLTVKNNEISSNFTNENFTYYTSATGATNAFPADLISNPLAFGNTTPTTMGVWCRIADKVTGCISVAKISLKVPSTNIPPTYKIPFAAVCDDFLDVNGNNNANNDKRDGITTFDFSSTKGTVLALLPTSQTYTINYYKNEADALAELNVIPDPSNYRNIGYPRSQDIWLRIDSDVDNACFGLGPYLTLNVETVPIANAVTIPRQCVSNTNGTYVFDTAVLESNLLKGQTNVTVTYFDGANNPLKDANGAPITSPFPATFITKTQTIRAVVTNNTPQGCFDETTINFIVDQAPQGFPIDPKLTTICDDETDPLQQDGKVAFATSSFEATILNGQSGMTVKYFDQNGNSLPSPLPNPFVSSTQNVKAIVQNPTNTLCSTEVIIPFIVQPTPKINLNTDRKADELICQNNPTFFVQIDASLQDGSDPNDYIYKWQKDGIAIGTNTYTLAVNQEGVYTVEVTNSNGCSKTRTVRVKASNVADFTVDVVDLADVNTVTVNATGPGVYQYSLDEPDGFWQDSNFFDKVASGVHIVYVNDKNGCGTVNQEIVVAGVPKFFTPNGDNYNDLWEIKGVLKYPQAELRVFDRYGRYLITLNATNKSWNGTYNGSPLPADDYWYILNLGNGEPAIKGHFSLKK
jgi:gliding motility-associated-like protein